MKILKIAFLGVLAGVSLPAEPIDIYFVPDTDSLAKVGSRGIENQKSISKIKGLKNIETRVTCLHFSENPTEKIEILKERGAKITELLASQNIQKDSITTQYVMRDNSGLSQFNEKCTICQRGSKDE